MAFKVVREFQLRQVKQVHSDQIKTSCILNESVLGRIIGTSARLGSNLDQYSHLMTYREAKLHTLQQIQNTVESENEC